MNKAPVRTIELLSPAKNLECGIAAIDHGADAVYIGGPGFGARKNAGNSLEDIEQLISYAHLFGVKVYIALNTLLFDNELQAANELAHQVYKLGADALIIQDMGLLETNLPPIPIHASTQTDNRSLDKVKFLEEVGFDQVVLARELSVKEIETIRQATSVPLEYFIHGALCVCYSGQCYMSAAINKRSANRGECAQPCRLRYSLKNRSGEALYHDKHLLSLKDLNLSGHLEQLVNAGISSFKIEGRLKDKDYVANVTAHYRQMLDDIIKRRSDVMRASSGSSVNSYTPEVGKSFNRGFTSYFINGRSTGIWSIDSPKNRGEQIGKVTQVGKDHFTIKGNTAIHNGDGLSFYTHKKELTGLKVNRTEGCKIYPNSMKDIRQGMTLFRNFDKAFTDSVNNNTTHRKIKVVIFLLENDKGFTLSIKDTDGLESSITRSMDAQTANNPGRALEQIQTQIAKLGSTIFEADNVHINLKNNWFFKAKDLNWLRRELIECHLQKRHEHFRAKERLTSPNSVPFPKAELNFTANIINQKARDFYTRHGVTNCDWGFEKQARVPNAELMRTRHCLLYMNNQCLKEHPEARQLLPLTLYNDKDSYLLEFDCKNCEMIIKKVK